jgi:hypothetical protein
MRRLFSRRGRDQPYVIGKEMAAATDAERKRLEVTSSSQSPMPEASYDRWQGELNLANPTHLPLDDQIVDLCRRFERTDEDDRAAVRRSISMDEFYTLLNFSRRSAVFALRDRRTELLRDGLLAIALIEAERVDYRDILGALSLLYHVAPRIGADASQQFKDAAALSEPAVAKLVTDFAARSPEHRDLRDAWGHVEIETASGVGFVGWGFRPYDPTYDLAAIALDIAGLLDADDYQPDDPELGTDLPAVWLRHAADPALQDVLGAIRAGATIHGRLRPGASAMHASQQLTIFLVEMREAIWAQRLVAMSEKPTESFALVGITEDKLFCLAFGRSFVQGVGAFETRESLGRFGPGIRKVLMRYVAAHP